MKFILKEVKMYLNKDLMKRLKQMLRSYECEYCYYEKTCNRNNITNDYCLKGQAIWLDTGEKDDEL